MEKLQPIMDFLGSCSLVAGCLIFAYRVWFLSHAVSVEGEVVEFQERSSGSDIDGGSSYDNTAYASVIAFRDENGRRVKFETKVHTLSRRHILGQTVDVRYDPAHPSRAILYSTADLWGLPGFLIFLGAYTYWDRLTAYFG